MSAESLPQVAFYYPGHLWHHPDWVKTLLLFLMEWLYLSQSTNRASQSSRIPCLRVRCATGRHFMPSRCPAWGSSAMPGWSKCFSNSSKREGLHESQRMVSPSLFTRQSAI